MRSGAVGFSSYCALNSPYCILSRNTEIIPTLDPLLQRAAVASYADALWVVFVFQIAIGVLGFLACLPIQENPLP